MNGAELKVMEPPVPQQIQELCDALPHFGDGWEKRIFASVEKPGLHIAMLIPPERLGIGVSPKFVSNITVMTTKGPAQLEFQIPNATTIAEAEHLWRSAAAGAIKEMHNNLQQNQRRVLLPSEASNAPFPRKLN